VTVSPSVKEGGPEFGRRNGGDSFYAWPDHAEPWTHRCVVSKCRRRRQAFRSVFRRRRSPVVSGPAANCGRDDGMLTAAAGNRAPRTARPGPARPGPHRLQEGSALGGGVYTPSEMGEQTLHHFPSFSSLFFSLPPPNHYPHTIIFCSFWLLSLVTAGYRSELDMDWIHSWIGLDWIGSGNNGPCPTLISLHELPNWSLGRSLSRN